MASTKLGDVAEGSIVKLRENGVLIGFYVAKHDYASDLNGMGRTLVVRKDCYDRRKWNEGVATASFSSATICAWLNDPYKKLLDPDIRTAMGVTKFQSFSRSVFLLNPTELEKFASGILKIAYLNKTAITQWTRDARKDGAGNVAVEWMTESGINQRVFGNSGGVYGSRPAFTLPATFSVNDDGEVLANEPPTTPDHLTLPEKIQGGGKTTVSWGASTDPDGNLEGYVLERSLDGGSTWTQVYQGGGLSTANTVPFGSGTVMYRVRAYDSEGAYSAYRTSAQMEVGNNTAPNTPGAINVPAAVDGGGTEIYRGTALSFQDSITKGWTDVAYRVTAFDSYGAESGWAVSPTRTVDNNTAPTVVSDSAADLGVQNEGFQVAYTVDDEDGDAVTVRETLDGTLKRQFSAVLGQPNTFDVTGEYFQRVLNGAHRLEVTATDAGGKSSALAVTFSKLVTVCSITLEQPMEADAPITVCVLSVTGSIPADAEYTLEVTNNALDDAPVWEDCMMAARNGANHVFANQTAENGFAFNFRLRAERGPSGLGGYITSVQGGFQ